MVENSFARRIGSQGTSQARKKVTILCSTRSGTLLERESDHRFNQKNRKPNTYEYQPLKRLVSIGPCLLLQGQDAVVSARVPALPDRLGLGGLPGRPDHDERLTLFKGSLVAHPDSTPFGPPIVVLTPVAKPGPPITPFVSRPKR